MKSLFNEDDTWTDKARDLDSRATAALRSIIAEYIAEFDSRHIEHIVTSAITMLTAELRVKRLQREHARSITRAHALAQALIEHERKTEKR